jgi:ArsR family transcriptional regulator
MNTDPAVILDILGNENRRRIISLLANRPCYVSEISGKLGIAPKAVLGHLDMLQSAGIIESRADDSQRRKYFGITTCTRLEIAVSPHTYAVRINEIPLSETPDDFGAHPKNDAADTAAGFSAVCAIHRRLTAVRQKQKELSQQQKQLHTEEEYWKAAFSKTVSGLFENDLDGDILILLMKKDMSAASLCHYLGLPPAEIVSGLRRLESASFVEKYDNDDEWLWKLSPSLSA